MYVGVTDSDWYSLLKEEKCEEVNFWKPGGNANFKALDVNDLFLFKLHSPLNYIVGGGFFVSFSILPTFLAWDAFGIKNGTRNLKELENRVLRYKRKNKMNMEASNIGCIILTEPFFFSESDWIPVPENWNKNIVQGKTYSLNDNIGMKLYKEVQERLIKAEIKESGMLIAKEAAERYGKEQIIKHRLGQGAFRIMVTDSYHRRCAITGEKTLPVLDAAHIKPYAEEGPHAIQNGILLRKDLHTLFDKGYITIDKDYKVEVSKRLHEDYGNGKIYYDQHGKALVNKPDNSIELPSKEFLEWHNENVYLG